MDSVLYKTSQILITILTRSKWHSALKSNLAHQGLTAKPRTIKTFVGTPISSAENQQEIVYMIQDHPMHPILKTQINQEPRQPRYKQIQVINSSNRPVCITGLQDLTYSNSSIPIVIQRPLERATSNQRLIYIGTRQSDQQVLQVKSTATARPRKIYYEINPSRETTKTRRIIRVPFLPRVPTTAPTVKQSSPLRILTVKTANPETLSSTIPSINLKRTPTANTLIDTDFSSCSHWANSSSSSIPYSESVSQTNSQKINSQPPMTLASMAGIQLTDSSVESHTLAMSGATMPTATVEEINVPVFIDEYLQQTLPSNSYDDNNNNSKSLSNNNNQEEGCTPVTVTATEGTEYINGTEDFCIEDCIIDIGDDSSIFENIEFDIGLIGSDENTTTTTNTIMQQNQQQEQLQQQQQQYNNNNNNNNYNYNYNMNETDLQNMLYEFATKSEVKEELEENETPLNNFFPCIDSQDMLTSQDYLWDESFGIDNINTAEEVVPIDDWKNNDQTPLLAMTSSQNNPMFCGNQFNFASTSNSQSFLCAEPHVPNYEPEFNTDEGSCIDIFNNIIQCEGDDVLFTSAIGTKRTYKDISVNTEVPVPIKRTKLTLDTSRHPQIPDIINTPDVVDIIVSFDKKQPTNIQTTQEILIDLVSNSNSSFQSAKQESNTPNTVDYSYEDSDESPNTPQSCISSYTNQTQLNITSPNSPALSTISSSTRINGISKSKRGRPPKTHSDRPNPSQLRNLSESERKRAEDRAKNNEASRLSRLKNKQREEEEITVLIELEERNKELNSEHDRLVNIEEKLRKVLKKKCQPK